MRDTIAHPGALPQMEGALGLLPCGLLQRHPVQECGDPVATSPGSPRSIWNPTLKARALLAGAQLPSSLDMPTPLD